jgi:hypothetical protein
VLNVITTKPLSSAWQLFHHPREQAKQPLFDSNSNDIALEVYELLWSLLSIQEQCFQAMHARLLASYTGIIAKVPLKI